MITKPDMLERLRIDPGQRTLGQLLQDREAALHEIRTLRMYIEQSTGPQTSAKLKSQAQKTAPERPHPMLIRLAELCEMLGVSRSTIYKWVSMETFPAPVRIGERAVRWRMRDVEAWQSALQ